MNEGNSLSAGTKFINGAVIALLTLVLCTSVGRAATATAHVVNLIGSATVMLPGETESKPLKIGSAVPVGSTVKTDANSRITLALVPGAASIIGAGATVVVTALEFETDGKKVNRKISLNDINGDVLSNMHKEPGTSNFDVMTPQGVAAARGTTFDVAVVNGTAKVSVVEGAVVVTVGGVTYTCSAGNVVETSSSGSTTTRAMTPAEASALSTALQAAGFSVTTTTTNGVTTYSVAAQGLQNPSVFSAPATPTPGSSPTPAPTPTPAPVSPN